MASNQAAPLSLDPAVHTSLTATSILPVAAVTLTGEGVGATNTAQIKVTIDQSATATLHRCLVLARILNDATGGGSLS